MMQGNIRGAYMEPKEREDLLFMIDQIIHYSYNEGFEDGTKNPIASEKYSKLCIDLYKKIEGLINNG